MTEPHKRPAFEPAERLLTRPHGDPDMKRPASTVAGAVLVLLRVVVGVLGIAEVALHWNVYAAQVDASLNGADVTPEMAHAALLVFVVVGGAVSVVDAVLAVLVLRGSNVARVIVMAFAVVSISTSFTAWWFQGQEITLHSSLPLLAIDILVLLALSSRGSAAYARRNERRGPGVS